MARRSTPKLTRDAILQAALDLADDGGLQAVTMRAVAERLGVTAMALYAHVGDKDGLLDGLVERILADFPKSRAGLNWEEQLRELGAGAIAVARRHPQAFPLLLNRPAVTKGALRTREVVFAALLGAGVPEADVPRLERLISTLVLGYAVSATTGRFGINRTPPERIAELPAEEYPAHHRLIGALSKDRQTDAEFFDVVYSMIEQAVRSG
ncbi:TetR/AcrR family transcriptional regulator [Flindersiella endophytica]